MIFSFRYDSTSSLIYATLFYLLLCVFVTFYINKNDEEKKPESLKDKLKYYQILINNKDKKSKFNINIYIK